MEVGLAFVVQPQNIQPLVCQALFGIAGYHIEPYRLVEPRYQHVFHHPSVEKFVEWSVTESITIVGIDNIPGSVPIERASLPKDSVLVFGQEGPGLSEEMIEATSQILAITQYGSTRSINAGVASGIAMYEWLSQHVN